MSLQLGDFLLGATIDMKFPTTALATAIGTTLSGSPAVACYPGNSTTEITAGVTLSVDFDARTGLNHVRVVATAANGYAPRTDYQIVATAGTVGGSTFVSYVLAHFSIQNRPQVDVAQTGTSQGGTATTITLDTNASTTDGIYDPSLVRIIAGTGAGQTRLIINYVGSTRVAAVDRDWRVTPDTTSIYEVLAAPNLISTNEGLAQAGAASTITLNSNASAVNDTYVGQIIQLRTGTGQDQSRRITAYNGTTKVATVDTAWVTNPASGTGYIIWPINVQSVGSVSGAVGSVTGAVGSVTGNVGGNVVGSVASVTGNVGGNVVGSVASVTGNVGGNVVGSVASVTGAVGSVTGNVGGNVGGNVVGSVASVVGAVGSVTGNVGGNVVGSVASVVAAVAITSNVKKNQALARFAFMMTDSTTHAPVTGKVVTVTRSLDGAAFAAGTLSAVVEISNGMYYVDFAAADLNGNVIILRATAAGSDDTFVTIITQP